MKEEVVVAMEAMPPGVSVFFMTAQSCSSHVPPSLSAITTHPPGPVPPSASLPASPDSSAWISF